MVFHLAALGMSNREIAEALTIEESTIKTHVKRILMKLDLRDRIQLVIFAYETGLYCLGRPTTDSRLPWRAAICGLGAKLLRTVVMSP